jgi:hypothetical protein
VPPPVPRRTLHPDQHEQDGDDPLSIGQRDQQCAYAYESAGSEHGGSDVVADGPSGGEVRNGTSRPEAEQHKGDLLTGHRCAARLF